jgi:hypothetical protein
LLFPTAVGPEQDKRKVATYELAVSRRFPL